jgi:uncharacterized protein YecT (DUF1311 family)
MRARLLLLLCGMAVCELAIARPTCDSKGFNSHSDQIACEIRQSQQRSQEVDRAFADLMSANDHFNRIPGTKPNIFTEWLKSDQVQWRAFTSKDCELQGEVTMGTAGSDVVQQCLQEAYTQRIQVLHQMAQLLGN